MSALRAVVTIMVMIVVNFMLSVLRDDSCWESVRKLKRGWHTETEDYLLCSDVDESVIA